MIQQLCPASRHIFLKEPSLLHLQPPIRVAGNLYGQYAQLKSIFAYGGPPPRSNYLFLGNYIDSQGMFLHTILLLLAFKIKYPENVYLLRGDHDDAEIEPIRVDEIDGMNCISSSSMQILHDCLESLPVAALINDKIFCIHSGISPHLHSLDQIMHIQRPTNLQHSPFPYDLLYKHPRSRSHVCEAKFLENHDLHLIRCGYQVVSSYEHFAENRVVYVSSATARPEFYHTCKDSDNSIMSVDANLKCSYRNLLYKNKSWSYHIVMAATIQHESSSGVKVACRKTLNKFEGNPALRKGSESGSGETKSEFGFDPANLYRSKSPGVKRFLAARV